MMAKTKVKTVYKVKWKNLGVIIFIFILAILLILGGIFSIKYVSCYNKTKEIIDKIHQNVEVKSIVDDEFIKTFKQNSKLSKFDIYWDYIKLGLIDADMGALKKMNSDTVGYMEIKGTDFSYPIVLNTADKYKTLSFDKKENQLGWLYTDKETSFEEMDTNSIVYGNKIFGKVLSGSLNTMFKPTWHEDKNNFIIRYSTSYYSSLWQIISVYHTKDKNTLKNNFESEEELQKYIESIINKSEIKFKASALPSDKFLTITTNSNGANVVVHAKLIKLREEQ